MARTSARATGKTLRSGAGPKAARSVGRRSGFPRIAGRAPCACGGGCPRCRPALLQAKPLGPISRAPTGTLQRQSINYADIDTALASAPLTGSYATARQKGGLKMAGNTDVLTATKFRSRFVEYAMQTNRPGAKPRRNPKTNTPFTYQEAIDYADSVQGFVDGGTSVLKQETLSVGTAVHEAIHKTAKNSGFSYSFGFHGNEGATEYFTQHVCTHNGLGCRTSVYRAELRAIEAFLAETGLDPATLAEAYFVGGARPLEAALGKPIVDAWAKEMKQGNLGVAKARLKRAIRKHGLPAAAPAPAPSPAPGNP